MCDIVCKAILKVSLSASLLQKSDCANALLCEKSVISEKKAENFWWYFRSFLHPAREAWGRRKEGKKKRNISLSISICLHCHLHNNRKFCSVEKKVFSPRKAMDVVHFAECAKDIFWRRQWTQPFLNFVTVNQFTTLYEEDILTHQAEGMTNYGKTE